MKKIIKIFALAVCFCSLFAFLPFGVKTARAYGGEIDRILSFDVYAEPNADATVNMRYEIEWKVLDDEQEGALEWVKIGVPNKYVYDLSCGGDVKSVEYLADSGAFIRADLRKSFYKNQVANIVFSFRQERLFTLGGDGKTVEFGFYPGWFDEIRVDRLTVHWKKVEGESVIFSDGSDEGDYRVWTKNNLVEGERLSPCKIKYSRATFANLDESKDYSDSYLRFVDVLPGVITVAFFVGIIVAVLIINANADGGYSAHRGFYGRGYARYNRVFFFFPRRGVNKKGDKIDLPLTGSGGGSGGSSGGGHSCACACACAGGGRAGCSRKDFYSPETTEFIKILKEDN